MGNELTIGNLQVNTFQELKSIAEIMVQSGMFPDTSSVAKAAVKILAGRELGFHPFASMTGIHVITGKPVIGANLLAALIKRSKVYDYRVITLNVQQCVLEFSQNGTVLGRSSMTLEEAKISGIALAKDGKNVKDNWFRSPANMLFARCISNGQKWYCPDLLLGVAVYTEDEITPEETILGPQEFIPHDPAPPEIEAVTDPNAQSPAEKTPQENPNTNLTPEQIQKLRDLYLQNPKTPQEFRRILATIQVKATDLIPTSQFEWVSRMIREGQISVEQSDRIAKLVEQLKLPWEKVASRLVQKFGEPTLVRLTPQQGYEIESSLKEALKKQTPPPASSPMPNPNPSSNPNSLLETARAVLTS